MDSRRNFIPLHKKKGFIQKVYEQRVLLLFIMPCIVWLAIFCYGPMGGIIIAFKDYKLSKGVFGSDWVGLLYFKHFFTSPITMNVVRNTVAISLIKLVFGFPIPIIFALLLNEIKNRYYYKTIQTISYLPHFLSWAICIVLFTTLFSVDGGIVNNVLGKLFGITPVNFFTDPKLVWPMAYLTEMWKETGWNAIIYIAALTGIEQSLYEAAEMDGATKWQRLWHISLPGIRSTIAILLIMATGGILNANFDQLYLMRNDAVLDTIEVIDTYVYQRSIFNMEYSFGTAMGLMKSIINIALLLITNQIIKKMNEESLF
jgi:ABC-type polysaccharide transport system, permease component